MALWEACRDVLRHWIELGVRIFRVDNPHTKPLAFWEWCIADVQADHPDVLFLAEAFTRPAMMSKLAEVGFTQSYTYFTWRHAKWELTEYVEELAHGPLADVMRPNFWPNTPDILGGVLRHGNRAAFMLRLAAGRHARARPRHLLRLRAERERAGVGHQRGVPALGEVRDQGPRLGPARLARPASSPASTQSAGATRRCSSCATSTSTTSTTTRSSPTRRATGPRRRQRRDLVLVVVNLDPYHVQEATVHLDLGAVGLPDGGPTGPTTSSPARPTSGRGRPTTCASTRPPIRSATCSTSAAPTVRRHDRALSTASIAADHRWYQRAVFYEVLVRGFNDSNDDGTGDLRGLIDRARLPRVAGRRLPLAAAVLPVAAARRRLRRLRLPHRAARVRHGRRRRRADRTGPPAWHPGHQPTWW